MVQHYTEGDGVRVASKLLLGGGGGGGGGGGADTYCGPMVVIATPTASSSSALHLKSGRECREQREGRVWEGEEGRGATPHSLRAATNLGHDGVTPLPSHSVEHCDCLQH